MFEINLFADKQNRCTIMKTYSKFAKRIKNINLCTDKFWDDTCFWRDMGGRPGKSYLYKILNLEVRF